MSSISHGEHAMGYYIVGVTMPPYISPAFNVEINFSLDNTWPIFSTRLRIVTINGCAIYGETEPLQHVAVFATVVFPEPAETASAQAHDAPSQPFPSALPPTL